MTITIYEWQGGNYIELEKIETGFSIDSWFDSEKWLEKHDDLKFISVSIMKFGVSIFVEKISENLQGESLHERVSRHLKISRKPN